MEGKTIIERVNDFKKLMEIHKISVNIYIVSFAAMGFGIKHIKEKLNYEIYCPLILKKGISEFDKMEEKSTKINTMLDMEKKLHKATLSCYSLGYEKSESLYHVYENNCPDNVFPIFWWPKNRDGKNRVTLFRRSK